VLVWEPTSRLVLTWDINANWQPAPTLKTEVEIRFIADGKNRTRVELEHRHLDRFGARRDQMRRVFALFSRAISRCVYRLTSLTRVLSVLLCHLLRLERGPPHVHPLR
jgi:hypothetical protein